MSHKMFASCLSERGFRKQKTRAVNVYHGIGLLVKEVYDTRPAGEPSGTRWTEGRMREPGED